MMEIKYFTFFEKEDLTYDELERHMDNYDDRVFYSRFCDLIISKTEENLLMVVCKFHPKLDFVHRVLCSTYDRGHRDINFNGPLYHLFLSKKDFDIDVVKFVSSIDNDICYTDIDGNSILHNMIIQRVLTRKKLRFLFEIDPSIINLKTCINEETPLMYLCEYFPNMKLMTSLIKYKADPELLNVCEQNCLFYLFRSNYKFDPDLVEYLISLGCDFRFNNCFMNIITYNKLSLRKLKMLLKFCPDLINVTDTYGATPLMYVCMKLPKLESIRLMVESGADVNMLNNEGENCFFYLLEKNKNIDLNIIRYLISKGCNIYHKDLYGKTVIDDFFNSLNFKTLNFLVNLNIKMNNTEDGKEYFNFKNFRNFDTNQIFY